MSLAIQETNLFVQCDLEKTYQTILNRLPIYKIIINKASNEIELRRPSVINIMIKCGLSSSAFVDYLTIYQTEIQQVVVHKKIKAQAMDQRKNKWYNDIKVNLVVNFTPSITLPKICFNEINLLVEDLNSHQTDNHFNESQNEMIEIKDEYTEKPHLVKAYLLKEIIEKDSKSQYMHLMDINNKNIRIKLSEVNTDLISNENKIWLIVKNIKGEEVIVNKQKYILGTRYSASSVVVLRDYYNNIHDVQNPNNKSVVSSIRNELYQKIAFDGRHTISFSPREQTRSSNSSFNLVTNSNSNIKIAPLRMSSLSQSQSRISEDEPSPNQSRSVKSKKEDKWISIKDINKEKILILHSILEKYIKTIMEAKENSFSEREEISDYNNQKKIIQPWKVVLAYLRKYYIEKIYPKEEPMIEISNKEESIRHLIRMSQLEQVQSSDEEIHLLDIDFVEFTITRNDLDNPLNKKWVLVELNDPTYNYFIREKDLLLLLRNNTMLQDINVINIFPKGKRNFYPPRFLANKYTEKREEQNQNGTESYILNTIQTISDVITTDEVLQTIESIRERENFDIEIYIQISDVNDYPRLVNKNEIKHFDKGDKVLKFIDVNRLCFNAHYDSCKDINANNQLNHIFALKDSSKKIAYIRKVDAMSIMNTLLYEPELFNEEEKLYDINQNPRIILYSEIINLLGATHLGECLQSKCEDNDDLELARINDSNIKIPKMEIIGFLNRLINKEKLFSREEILTSSGTPCFINPFTLRKLKTKSANEKTIEIIPYVLSSSSYSYFEVTRMPQFKKELLSKKDILALISSNRKLDDYNIHELKLALNEENKQNEYIIIRDSTDNICFIKKCEISLLINDLMNNIEINDYKSIKDNEGVFRNISVKSFIKENYAIQSSPYMKDEILRQDSTTYYNINQAMVPKTKVKVKQFPGSELDEYVLIKDIQEKDCYILKPFIRRCLWQKKNLISNPVIVDRFNQSHIIPLFNITSLSKCKLKYTDLNNNIIPSNIIFVEIYDYGKQIHLISVDKVNLGISLARKECYDQMMIQDANGRNIKWGYLQIPRDLYKSRRWIKIQNALRKSIFVYWSIIKNILLNQMNSIKNAQEMEVNDYECIKHLIYPNDIASIFLNHNRNLEDDTKQKLYCINADFSLN